MAGLRGINVKADLSPPFPGSICYLARMDERIIQLERLSAIQEKTLHDLNEELYRQQQDIVRLQSRVAELEERLAEFGEPGEIAGNEPPPHW
jgi:uncharacterized coiled-coil protein SlyX